VSRFTLVAPALLAAVVAVACGQATTATIVPSVGPAASWAGSGAPAASTAAAPTPPATSASPSTSVSSAPTSPAATGSSAGSPRATTAGEDLSGFTDLRQLIPDMVGAHALTKTLYTGDDFVAFPASVSDQMRALLKSLDREVTDLTMAVAADPTSAIDVTITAFRVRDIQADAFFDAYVPLVTGSFPSATINETVLGGKTAWDVSLDGQAAGTTFLYPRDDVLFIVTGTDLALVDLAFAALP